MKQIGTLGTIDTLTVGERVFTDLANLIILSGNSAASPNVLCGLSKTPAASPTAYQVTTGKTLKIAALRVFGYSAAANFGGALYGDTALPVNTGTATPPTNQISDNLQGYFPAAIGGTVSFVTNFDVPATKYVGAYAEASYVTAFGYET